MPNIPAYGLISKTFGRRYRFQPSDSELWVRPLEISVEWRNMASTVCGCEFQLDVPVCKLSGSLMESFWYDLRCRIHEKHELFWHGMRGPDRSQRNGS